MNEDQIKIAEELLTYLKENDGFTTADGYPSLLQERNHNYQDFRVVVKMLIDQNLIEETNDESRIRIKNEGEFAVSMGYPTYIIYLHKKRKDKDAVDHKHAIHSKWQIIIFWPMFVFATVGTATGIISLIWLIIKSMK